MKIKKALKFIVELVKDFIDFPYGWEDEDGFHYGKPNKGE